MLRVNPAGTVYSPNRVMPMLGGIMARVVPPPASRMVSVPALVLPEPADMMRAELMRKTWDGNATGVVPLSVTVWESSL